MNETETASLAKVLDDAMLRTREIPPLTQTRGDFPLEDAYRIQDAGIALRVGRGERVIGRKMGFTSRAKMEQMGLDKSIYGVLTDRMQLTDGSVFSLRGKIHPKIEPEIAFLTKKELGGDVSPEEALAACEGVCAAMEILDSRFLNFKYFSLPDVVADNCSSAFFVTSARFQKLGLGELAKLKMTMVVNGKTVQSATSDAILGNPINSLVHLCELLGSHGKSLPAGSIVLAGAATQAVALEHRMQVRLQVEGLANVQLTALE